MGRLTEVAVVVVVVVVVVDFGELLVVLARVLILASVLVLGGDIADGGAEATMQTGPV